MRGINEVSDSGLNPIEAGEALVALARAAFPLPVAPIDFVRDVERALKEACAVETVLPEWRPPSKEQQRLEARAAASSQRLAGAVTAPKPRAKPKKVWRAEQLLDKMIAAENRYYRAQLSRLQKQMRTTVNCMEETCCVPSRARTIEQAAVWDELRKTERYLSEAERP